MNRVLVIVDYQKDFVDGKLGNPAAREIETAICRKIEEYLASGDDLIFLMDTHEERDLTAREFEFAHCLHCVQDSEGWHIYGKVADYVPQAKYVIRKNCYGSAELGDVLRQNQYEVVELAGVTTHSCVFSNAIIAAAAVPRAQILVDAACTASANEDQKNASLEMLQKLHIQVKF